MGVREYLICMYILMFFTLPSSVQLGVIATRNARAEKVSEMGCKCTEAMRYIL